MLEEGWNAALMHKGARAQMSRLESQAIQSQAERDQAATSYRDTYSLLSGARLLIEAGFKKERVITQRARTHVVERDFRTVAWL